MNLPEEEPVIAQPYLASDVRSTSWAEARRHLAEAGTS
jgi:hypothetical protein